MNTLISAKKIEYRIKRSHKNSEQYGICSRCGQKCAPVYVQQSKSTRETEWADSNTGHSECMMTGSWTFARIDETL